VSEHRQTLTAWLENREALVVLFAEARLARAVAGSVPDIAWEKPCGALWQAAILSHPAGRHALWWFVRGVAPFCGAGATGFALSLGRLGMMAAAREHS